jgi:hypothetical protein
LVPGRQQDGRNRGGLADADGLHVGLDELHRVVDGKPGRNRPTWAVQVELDVLVGVLGLQEQHLRDGQVGHRVINRRADEDDVVLQEARKNVVGALAPIGLLDDHWDKLHTGIRGVSRHKRFVFSALCGMSGQFLSGPNEGLGGQGRLPRRSSLLNDCSTRPQEVNRLLPT